MFYSILLVVQVILAIAITVLVLVQHGEGADAGAAFGSGASGTVFGSQGSANFLSRSTAVLAALFFIASMSLAYLVHNSSTNTGASVVNELKTQKSSSSVPTDKLTAPKTTKSGGAAQASGNQATAGNKAVSGASGQAQSKGQGSGASKPNGSNADSNIPQAPPAAGNQ